MINDNILALLNRTPDSILQEVAAKIKSRRLERNWTQEFLSSKAGMPLATYRRFERSGEISLRSLVSLSIVLGLEDDFSSLFSTKSYQSIDDLIESKSNKQRKRATKNE
ncbi:MAG: helix-turn-helix transcriptional regulator [Rikenellaceae bacterium]